MKEAPACRPASRGACGAGTLILTHSDSRNARRPCHMGRPPRSGLECRGQLAYARKGLASGQPANARTGETNPGISSGRDSALRAGRGPSSPAGFLVKCRRNPGQVSPESWSSVAGILVKCRRNLGQVSPESWSSEPEIADVPDVEAFCTQAAERGLPIGAVHKAGGYVFANAKDPAGNAISISSRAYRYADFLKASD